MNHALLYRSGSRWTTAMAFTVAAMIHVGAVAFGSFHREIPVTSGSDPVEGVIDPQPDVTPVPVFEPVPDSAPAVSESDFIEAPSPPRRVVKEYRPAPVRPPATGGVTNWHGKASVISAPRPEYPYEARRRRLTGSGTVVVTVDPATGSVVSARMERSIGSPILDNAAISAFKPWRFKPGNASSVRIPVTFDLNGVSY